MSMEKLKDDLSKAKRHGKENDGCDYMMSEDGPAGFKLIDDIVIILEAQQKQIEELKREVAKGSRFS
jgi:hypothetical protein